MYVSLDPLHDITQRWIHKYLTVSSLQFPSSFVFQRVFRYQRTANQLLISPKKEDGCDSTL